MRLPTVRVWDARKRRVRVFDSFDYQLSGKLADPRFRVLGEAHGEAGDAEIAEAAAQAAKEAARAANPAHPAAHDAARAHAFAKGHAAMAGETDWRRLQWFRVRRYIKELTGELPTSKEHAEEIMAAFDARGGAKND